MGLKQVGQGNLVIFEFGTVETPDWASIAKFPAVPSLIVAGPVTETWLNKAYEYTCQQVVREAVGKMHEP